MLRDEARARTLSPIRSIAPASGRRNVNAGLGDRARKARVLRQKAIAGMDRARAAGLGRRDDLRAIEIGRDRRAAGDLRMTCGGRTHRSTASAA